uniref:Uncharacterized protein n=1 Tax=Kalanchoe fedtschenkoi TaxID=63787 RepID=A0A7N0SYH9_KALFE
MRMHLAAREGKLGALSSMGRIKSKRKLATVAEASQMARHSDFAKRQDKFPATVKSKHVDLHSYSTGKKLKTGTRRSQRIRSLPKPAENQNKPQVCEVDDSDSEIEVELGVQIEEKSSKPTIKPQDVQMVTVKRKEEKSPKIKKTHEVVDNAPRLNDDVVAAALTEEERLDKITEKTREMESSFVMGLMAKKQDKAPVMLDDFRDQISELTEKLDIANGRLEVYQKTMNPQMVDMLRDFLASANQSQTGEVPRSTSSEKDSGVRRSIKPRSRSSRKRKPPFK